MVFLTPVAGRVSARCLQRVQVVTKSQVSTMYPKWCKAIYERKPCTQSYILYIYNNIVSISQRMSQLSGTPSIHIYCVVSISMYIYYIYPSELALNDLPRTTSGWPPNVWEVEYMDRWGGSAFRTAEVWAKGARETHTPSWVAWAVADTKVIEPSDTMIHMDKHCNCWIALDKGTQNINPKILNKLVTHSLEMLNLAKIHYKCGLHTYVYICCMSIGMSRTVYQLGQTWKFTMIFSQGELGTQSTDMELIELCPTNIYIYI